MSSGTAIDRTRAVADAVLYEGYLLYPYRSTSAKNRVRWQFGVLGPPGAESAGLGEESDLAVQCLLAPPPAAPEPGRPAPAGAAPAGAVAGDPASAELRVRLRFLQLQAREVEQATGPDPADGYTPVPELTMAGQRWLRWDEAAERELELGPYPLVDGFIHKHRVEIPGGTDVEPLTGPDWRAFGRLVRRREPLAATVTVTVRAVDPPAPGGDGALRLSVAVRNVTAGEFTDRDAASALSLLGAHLILVADGAAFLSMIDPPDWARDAAGRCAQHRCWPVLGGDDGDHDVMLAAPIILYDHPAVAPESAGALFDSTEIDEILTLRVMTLTDEEKAVARATDAHAAAIIDRCDRLTPAELGRLHGILRDPRADTGAFRPFADAPDRDVPTPFAPGADLAVPTWATPADQPWWDPAVDAAVDPATDSVLVGGVDVRRDTMVRLRPHRRADAQDLFYAGQLARVTAVLGDVDGGSHVAVVLADDPAADLHEWYGRYLYFTPDELEPLPANEPHDANTDSRREGRS